MVESKPLLQCTQFLGFPQKKLNFTRPLSVSRELLQSVYHDVKRLSRLRSLPESSYSKNTLASCVIYRSVLSTPNLLAYRIHPLHSTKTGCGLTGGGHSTMVQIWNDVPDWVGHSYVTSLQHFFPACTLP